MTPPCPRTAQELIDEAHLSFAQGNLLSTRTALTAALALKPASAELNLALGHVELQLQNLRQSLECYAAAARLKPAWSAAHASHAMALQLLGNSAEAEAAAQRALVFDPLDRVALLVLARVHLDARRHEQARALCRRVLDQNPRDSDALALLSQCRFDLDQFLATWPTTVPSENNDSPRMERITQNHGKPPCDHPIIIEESTGGWPQHMQRRAVNGSRSEGTESNITLN